MRELAPGLSHWTARHPDWTPEQGGPEGWDAEVSSYLYEAPGALVLFDPLSPAWDDLDERVERLGPPAILLTVYWHARSSQAIVNRYRGTRVFAHDQVLEEARKRVAAADPFQSGAVLPGAVRTLETDMTGEALFFVPALGALVAGDVLLGTPDGGARLCPDSWLDESTTLEALRRSLGPILDLPVDALLLTHGEPVLENARAALESALAR